MRIELLSTARLLIAIAALLAAALTAHADDWTDGNNAFVRGDFRSALQSFESARDAGLTGPAVHYNIAVCQYKLARYRDAGRSFSFIAREFPKMAGLAEYNLGLVAQKLGEPETAAEHFLNAYRLSPDDEKLRILASNRLADTEIDMPARRLVRGAVGLRGGYDDNVALRDTDVISSGVTSESPMIDLFASVTGPISSRVDALSFDANIYAVRYVDADEFDQHGLGAGASYAWQRGDWQLRAGPQIGAGWLGGDAFDRRIGARFEARRALDDGSTLRLTYVFDDVSDGDDLFQGIDGRRHLLDARYDRTFSNGQRLRLRFRFEDNDRLDAGVSPTRTGVSIDYGLPLYTHWILEGGIELRRSRYDAVQLPREEDLLALEASLLRRLGRDWSLLLEYRFSDNDSDDPDFSYDRNAITIGIMRSF